jgi:hypothetical protein
VGGRVGDTEVTTATTFHKLTMLPGHAAADCVQSQPPLSAKQACCLQGLDMLCSGA